MKIPCHEIIRLTAREYGVSVSDLLERGRSAKVIEARRMAYRLIRDLRKDVSSLVIARVFRGRDHTTVLHGAKVALELIETNAEARARYDAIKDKAYQWKPPVNVVLFSLEGRAPQ